VTLQDLDPLEIHSGVVVGPRRTPKADDGAAHDGGHPRDVLEAILVPALSKPPCSVLFSGGRDSSVILAAAVDVARRHGLPEPIPLTMRAADHPGTWETDWQEMTIRHLGLAEWRRIEVSTELDTLGPTATDTIRRFGVYWPSNAHNMRYFAREAGGTLLTGGGGDELFNRWYLRRIPIKMLRRRRPFSHAAKMIALQQLPKPLRRRIIESRYRPPIPYWLRDDARDELQGRFDAARGGAPTWGQGLEAALSTRYTELVRTAMDTFARQEGVWLVEPFYDASMITAVANTGPKNGYPSRGQALEALFGELLPRQVLYRSTKAHFTGLSWGPCARGFAAAWDGSGLDDGLVDPEKLRAEWAKERPSALSVACLHQAWYSSQGAQ
jgi:asparagine synthase (glutamine-hydrolysing)